MKYAAINIQGNILTSEILEKIRTEDFRFQKPLDFGFEPTSSLKDEISLAYSVATSHWKAFQHKREKLRDSETGTTDTRRAWMIPLLQLLGFDISVANAEIINGKSYAISHRATNLEGFPVHVVGVNQSLDKRADSGGARLSPHALGQEYLNNHDHLYAIVSNGKYLRLLRDATLLSRLSFVEFDLEQIMEENLYAEFALMFRLLHASRMPQKIEEGPGSNMEFYHVEALASGSRIRERLSMAVEASIKDLANGLMAHPSNKQLREAVKNDEIKAKDYYLYNLRTIYRILFLLVIEDRKLIYPEKVDEELARKQKIYYDFYSLQRLTNLAEKLVYVDPKKTDLWDSLLTTFSLFEYKEYGDKLGIAPLGSGIFHPDSLGRIRDQKLDNETLLKVLRCLVSFENENKQRVRVNYADLDVEEFGSVYEGLLEYEPKFEEQLGIPVFTFVEGDERSSSGSHYTPEELVKPLIDHSLQYQIEEKLKEDDPEKGLLSLTVCDVACGSGHILLSAARRIGFELAKVRSGEDQPTPSLLLIAVRDVINNCIYGVDLNPLAVELCKVALWLEAHQPGEPLNFLDHHIKCGNAIVGLAHFEELKNGIATEAFKTLPRDDKEVAATFRKANIEQLKAKGQLSLHDLDKVETEVKDIQKEFTSFLKMPEHTPKQIEAKTKAYESLTSGKKWFRVKQLADLQVAQFFIPKKEENREKLTTEANYQNYLNSGAQIQDRGASMAMAAEKRFFHWFLEFPQVFGSGGFDCILGNPPYLGGAEISANYSHSLMTYLYSTYYPARNRADLSVYFLRRDFELINKKGFVSLITTNSICEGDSREGGLYYLRKKRGRLIYAVKSIKWPGEANLSVSTFVITKSSARYPLILNSEKVDYISSFLDDEEDILEPQPLTQNSEKTFLGCKLLGDGFIIDNNTFKKWIDEDENNKDVLFPILNGQALNSKASFEKIDYSINFKELSRSEAEKYNKPFQHVLQNVKPVRDSVTESGPRKFWWKYARSRPAMFRQLDRSDSCLVWARTTKYFVPLTLQSRYTFTDAICVGVFQSEEATIIKSVIHQIWARKYSGRTEVRLRYSIEDALNKFPLPTLKSPRDKLSQIGIEHNSHLLKTMRILKLGITDIYNQYHNPMLSKYANPNEPVKKNDKVSWALYKHLDTRNNSKISFRDSIKLIEELRSIQKKLDKYVLSVFGWEDINLYYDFHDVNYLPDKDNTRFTIHPNARKEILKRLLKLNHQRFEEEAAEGLHKKKDVEAYFKQKEKEIPEEIAVHFSKKKSKSSKKKTSRKPKKVEEPSSVYKLDFGGETVVTEICRVQIKNGSAKEYYYHLTPIAVKGEFTGEFKQIKPDSALAKAMIGQSEGDKFEFGELEYKILKIE